MQFSSYRKKKTLKFLFIILLISPYFSCSKDNDNIVITEPDQQNKDNNEEIEIENNNSSGGIENEDGTTDDDSVRSEKDFEGPSDEEGTGDTEKDEEIRKPCSNAKNFVFLEQNGLVNVEFENAEFSGDWKLKAEGNGFSGKGYMVWVGDQHLGNPGIGKTTFNIRIENPGTYQFSWKTAVKTGNSGTDYNDSWLRFADADDFYGQKDDSIVYPKDTGKAPNPAGASKDGWFKIYRSGNDLNFKWQAKTFDNDPHDIFVKFENPGIYTMEVSVRSSGHGIDKFVLFKDMSKENATADSNALSGVSCN